MTRAFALILSLTLMSAAGAARAEATLNIPPYPIVAPIKGPAMSPSPAFAATRPNLSLPVRYAQAPTPLPPGVARTSVETRIDRGPTASAGVLCGLQPNADTSGAGTARGYDPQGKFVGTKLSFAF